MNQGDLTAAVRTAMTVLGIDDSKECIDCELSEPEVASTLNDAVPRAELLIRCPTLACQPFMVLTLAFSLSQLVTSVCVEGTARAAPLPCRIYAYVTAGG